MRKKLLIARTTARYPSSEPPTLSTGCVHHHMTPNCPVSDSRIITPAFDHANPRTQASQPVR